MKSIFRDEDIKILIENYPKYGTEYCSKLLNKTTSQIRKKIGKIRNRYNLKMDSKSRSKVISNGMLNHPKSYENYSVNPSQFFDIKTKEVAYILGLIWSDGYVYHKQYSNVVSVSMIKDDIQHLIPIFDKTGKWNKVFRKREKKKVSITISINNKPLVEFLLKNDYKSKSSCSADKILYIIPKELHLYWFRGLFDGDGNVYNNKKNFCRSISIASSYDQDWKYCEKLFDKLDVRYTISRRKQKSKIGKINKSSVIRISNKDGIIKLGNYLYPNLKFDGMGLKRKFDKIKQINDEHHRKL